MDNSFASKNMALNVKFQNLLVRSCTPNPNALTENYIAMFYIAVSALWFAVQLRTSGIRN